jgi:hypothetical protein
VNRGSRTERVEAWCAARYLSVVLGWALTLGPAGCTADLTEECLGGRCAADSTTATDQASGGDGGAGGHGQACPPSDAAGELPCEVAAVLAAKCATCHSPDELSHSGAPFALVTYADTQALLGERPRWQRMREVIQPDGIPHMPLGSAPQLTVEEKRVLDTWFEACAPPRAAGASCP